MDSSARIRNLRSKTISGERYLSLEQAKIITEVYRTKEDMPVILKRAHSLHSALSEIRIRIDPEEIIVGNRTPGIRSGVVFPEAGISWITGEIDTLPDRPQDPFRVKADDKEYFMDNIVPFWSGKTLEDDIVDEYGEEIKTLEKVVKINQKDHAQGHICPDTATWLKYGPAGLLKIVSQKAGNSSGEKKLFYESAAICLEGACRFMRRYGKLAYELSQKSENAEFRDNLLNISLICNSLSERPASDFREAVQSAWFMFVILQMESNASSFSPGRMDQYLYPFFIKDIGRGVDPATIQEVLDALFIKFNQVVYMRNRHSARYFAGFPIGFNITIGGQTKDGKDATNDLTYYFLRAQDHIRLPQPNLTARLYRNSPEEFIEECSRIIGLGTGMPQIVNDESIVPCLTSFGIEMEDSLDYALVGCVEISPQGNFLGWSDAAMFNMVKVLELTLNDGKCMLTGKQLGISTGDLSSYADFGSLERAFRKQMDHYVRRMIKACEVVEKCHQEHLPSPFLSCVVKDCIEKGIDVTRGGARYNMSGIQAIQVANVADSMAALKKLVFEEKIISGGELLEILRNNFEGNEAFRQICISRAPKYGNDVTWVDELGAKWAEEFAKMLSGYRNFRSGSYHMGLYTVSAHVPMGQNAGATPDGRLSCSPLADGGLSPMYGRDREGPTAVLNSVSRIPSNLAPNGTLLNMKFLPSLFSDVNDRNKFSTFLKTFIMLPIHHIQFNVVTADELMRAKADPASYRGLTIRVAGYTAFFTELAPDLQDEIIRRTTQEG